MCVRRACLKVERFWGHKISRFRPQSMPFPICCLQHRRCIERLSWGICILEDSILNFLYCMESEHSPSCIGHIWVMIEWSSKDVQSFLLHDLYTWIRVEREEEEENRDIHDLHRFLSPSLDIGSDALEKELFFAAADNQADSLPRKIGFKGSFIRSTLAVSFPSALDACWRWYAGSFMDIDWAIRASEGWRLLTDASCLRFAWITRR